MKLSKLLHVVSVVLGLIGMAMFWFLRNGAPIHDLEPDFLVSNSVSTVSTAFFLKKANGTSIAI